MHTLFQLHLQNIKNFIVCLFRQLLNFSHHLVQNKSCIKKVVEKLENLNKNKLEEVSEFLLTLRLLKRELSLKQKEFEARTSWGPKSDMVDIFKNLKDFKDTITEFSKNNSRYLRKNLHKLHTIIYTKLRVFCKVQHFSFFFSRIFSISSSAFSLFSFSRIWLLLRKT